MNPMVCLHRERPANHRGKVLRIKDWETLRKKFPQDLPGKDSAKKDFQQPVEVTRRKIMKNQPASTP